MEDIYSEVRDRIERAKLLASSLGKVVGRISRTMPSDVDEEDREVAVTMSPETYYSIPYMGRENLLLGVVDIKSLLFVLLRVKGYSRRDAAAILYNAEMSHVLEDGNDDAGSLMTNVILKCEALTQMDVLTNGEPEASDIVIEPQSPVILPNHELIEKSLGVNRGGLQLGFLDSNEGVKVSLSLDDLNYHMLVVGTTGAGKTSFVKNLLAETSLLEDEVRSFVIDATGDYYHIVMPPSERNEQFEKLFRKIRGVGIDIVYPLSRRWLARNKDVTTISDFTARYAKNYLEPIMKSLEENGKNVALSMSENRIVITSDDWASTVTIHPFFFTFKESRTILPKLNPYFTEQASHFLKIFLKREKTEAKTLSEYVDFLNDKEKEFQEFYKIHKNTWDNVVRGLSLLRETGLFDLKFERERINDAITKSSKIVVLDLYNGDIDDFSQKVVMYYFLDKLFTEREKELRTGSLKSRYHVIIDEAHRFFPSRDNADDEVYLRKVSGKISLMMRLGRRRKLGFTFVTHDPTDLNEIVEQLANTKVVFRIRDTIAERLGIPSKEAKKLSWERNGKAYVVSPWFRENYVKVNIPLPPPLGHYDLSRV
ncbi:ATPase AAA [Sulfolobales archaeon HS-7]|nr:ATPase AAA [Sulfolobales archaeon HS-7]